VPHGSGLTLQTGRGLQSGIGRHAVFSRQGEEGLSQIHGAC
jgi:hypothetical protein